MAQVADNKPAASPPPPPVIRSRDLFEGSNTLRIEHEGQTYLLRITREKKLILTK